MARPGPGGRRSGRATDRVGRAPAASGGKGPKPIGVPEGYFALSEPYYATDPRAPAYVGGAGIGLVRSPVPPRYYAGDQFAPAGMGREHIKRIQLALEAGDWYTKGARITYGIWDPETLLAYEKALKSANASGKAVEQVLMESAASAAEGIGGPGGGVTGPKRGDYTLPVIQIENPDDLKDVFRTVSQNLMGFDPPEEEINSMILAYQAMSRSSQEQMLDLEQQQYAAREAGQTGYGAPVEVVAPPNPQAFGERQIREKYGGQIFAYNFTRAMPAIEQFLKE